MRLTRSDCRCQGGHGHDFIMSLPDGYKTEVNERGSGLWGRDSLFHSPALLADPRILVLDEATEHRHKDRNGSAGRAQRLLKGGHRS